MKLTTFKKNRLKRLFLILLLFPVLSIAQVGINTTSPSAGSILDITSTDKGLLVPRVNITDLSTIAPITGGAPAGLLVYNTNTTTGPGFVFWDGGDWTTVDGGQDWQKNGNAATTPGTDYIGTSDAQDFAIGTTGTERARVLANGQVLINGTTALDPGDRFTTYGLAAESVINGYSIGGGIGLYGEETGGGIGAFGNTSGTGWGITGQNNGTGIGVIGFSANNGVGTQGQNNGTGLGVLGSNSSTGTGTQGQNLTTGTGVFGYSESWTGVQGFTNTDGSAFSAGILGASANVQSVGVWADNPAETGIIGSGNGAAGTYITNTGGSFESAGLAAIGLTTNAAGTGMVGMGNASANLGALLPTGTGISGIGLTTGVHGYAGTGAIAVANQGNAAGYFELDTDNDVTTGGNDDMRAIAILAGYDNADPDGGGIEPADDLYFGGYFSGGNQSGTPTFAYVGLRHNPSTTGNSSGGTTDYKIIGTGSVSTLVNDVDNKPRVLFAPEAPEIVFQDYGVGQMVNGQARIDLDPILSKSIYVDAQHPLKVFVTLEGDCKGVYVTNKSANGFTVKELQGGTSNVPFSWQIVANRADTKDANGNIISKHVDVRLPLGPTARKVKKHEAKDALKHEVKKTSKSKGVLTTPQLVQDSSKLKKAISGSN